MPEIPKSAGGVQWGPSGGAIGGRTRSGELSSRNRVKEIDLICLSDSLSDTESDTTVLVEHLPQTVQSVPPTSIPILPKKEVVKPHPFVMNSWQSLKHYLQTYERYFFAKFEGSSYDCTQELSNFLPPEMEEYYNALGGHRLRYQDMKSELIAWYRTQKVGGAKYWREQLRDAHMHPGESLKLYGLRLRELGQKSYPHDDDECVREIRHQFLKGAPGEFARQVHYLENSSLVHREGKKLNWASIMKLAEREDERVRKQEKSKHVNFSHNRDMWFSRRETKDAHLGKPATQRLQASRNDFYDDRYCQLEDDSGAPAAQWRREPFCAALSRGRGSHSRQTMTPPLRVNLSQQSVSSQTEEQHASYMGRGEMSPRGSRTFAARGRQNLSSFQQSTRNRRNIPDCDWCGKQGHGENKCWKKRGACTACGDPTHTRLECTNLRPRNSIFQEICSICQGAHADRDCQQRLN